MRSERWRLVYRTKDRQGGRCRKKIYRIVWAVGEKWCIVFGRGEGVCEGVRRRKSALGQGAKRAGQVNRGRAKGLGDRNKGHAEGQRLYLLQSREERDETQRNVWKAGWSLQNDKERKRNK